MNPVTTLSRFARICLALTGAVILASISPAQTAGTGTVEGRVLNVTNGQYVKNARVTVEGTNLESITNEFGEYRLVDVPGGNARIKTAYGGLPAVTQIVA